MAEVASSSNKWAVLVGITELPKIPFKLQGSNNDVKLMAEILQNRFAFPGSNVKILLDSEATRAGTLAGCDWLLDQVGPDDIAVFYYSGEIAFQSVTLDDSNKILVTYDYGGEGTPTAGISYDEMYQWLTKLSAVTPNAVVIIDASHSGQIGLAAGKQHQQKPGYLFLGACQSNQIALTNTFEGVIHGQFTYVLGQGLISAGPNTTYDDIFRRVSAKIGFFQTPYMEGDADRLLFGTGSKERTRFVTVIERSQERIQLNAGAVHGLTVGSQWTIYPARTRRVTDKTRKLGVVEITSVGATQSEARILSEAGADEVKVGTFAREELHYYGDMRLTVEIRDPAQLEEPVQALAKLLRESELIRIADPNEHAPIRIWVVPPREGAAEGDPVSQLGMVKDPTWAAVDEAGRLIMPPYPASKTQHLWELRDNLEKTARYRNILGLRNPNMNSPLAGKVDFVIKRLTSDGRWETAKPEPKTGVPYFVEGDRLAFEIVNRHKAPIYVSVLDFGVDASIDIVYPREGGSAPLKPSGRIEMGRRAGDELIVSLPEGFPFAEDPNNTKSSTWLETLKLFATAYETDFGSLLLQDGMRGTSRSMGDSTGLWQLLDMGLTGYGTRDRRPVDLPPDQDWTTVERSFLLRRRG
jgi:hypothetical protein